MDEWVRALGARPRIAYEPLGYEALRAANRIAFGNDSIPHYAIGEASYLLSFGADFLETWLQPVAYAGGFARMHAFAHGRAGTFVQIEPRLSMTGANADEWVRNAPGTEGAAGARDAEADRGRGTRSRRGRRAATLREGRRGRGRGGGRQAAGVPAETITRVAHDFAAARAASPSGAATASAAPTRRRRSSPSTCSTSRSAPSVRASASEATPRFGKVSPYAEMTGLTEAMAKGEIDVLVLADVNPVYTMPPKSGFADALAKVPIVVSLSNRSNETVARATLVLPTLHPLESWGDYDAADGVIGLMQPTMGPVPIDGKPVEGKSTGELLLSVGRQALGEEAARARSRGGASRHF